MQIRLLFLVFLGLCMGFKGSGDDEPIVRPLDPFVFRTTLDDRPRMISLALHPKLWVAYDAATCNLYKAWNGKINFDGTVFNNIPGPQPTSEGYTFIGYAERETRWRVIVDGKTIVPKTHFLGYTILDKKVTFNFELELPDGHRIKMTEYPEYDEKKSGAMTGLVRIITTDNVPKGVEVVLPVVYDAMLFPGDIKTDGKMNKKSKVKRHFDWGSTYDFEGELLLNSNEPTELRTFFALNPEDVMGTN
ncbi:MAG: hypothetical protein AAF927_18355 [Bacteroidota bacterium]